MLTVMLAQGRVDVGGVDTEIGAPSGVIEDFLTSIGWAYPLLSAAGAILFVYLVVKLIWDRKNPQQGGMGARGMGSAVGAILALAIFFRPSLIGLAADFGLGVVNRFADWFTSLLS